MYLHSFSLTRFGAAEGRAAAPGGERGAAAEGARGFRGIVIMNRESDSDSDSNSDSNSDGDSNSNSNH